jgi:hypothetical protein
LTQFCSALSVASISGDPVNPSRNGWWTLKYLNNAFRNINAAAGKTITVSGDDVRLTDAKSKDIAREPPIAHSGREFMLALQAVHKQNAI